MHNTILLSRGPLQNRMSVMIKKRKDEAKKDTKPIHAKDVDMILNNIFLDTANFGLPRINLHHGYAIAYAIHPTIYVIHV